MEKPNSSTKQTDKAIPTPNPSKESNFDGFTPKSGCRMAECHNPIENWDQHDFCLIHRSCMSRNTLCLRPNECDICQEGGPDQIGMMTLIMAEKEWKAERECLHAFSSKEICDSIPFGSRSFEFRKAYQCRKLKNHEELKSYYELLELFAYGIFADLHNKSTSLPQLTEAMLKKLRHLTLISLATGQKSLSLSDLAIQLEILSTRQLEDLIIEAIYAGIVSGRLDQKNGVLEVDFAIGRDIKSEDLQNIATTLQEWCQTCDMMLANVDNLITEANLCKDENTKQKNALDQELCNIKESLKVQLQDCDDQLVSESRDMDKKRHKQKTGRGMTTSKFWQKT